MIDAKFRSNLMLFVKVMQMYRWVLWFSYATPYC